MRFLSAVAVIPASVAVLAARLLARAIPVLTALTIMAVAAHAEEPRALEVGGQAPAFGEVAWVKGGAPASGTAVTVVELWSTGSAPCRAAIPQLTHLQLRHPDIAIVGVTSEPRESVAPFVAKQGDEIGYRVGIVSEPVWNAWTAGVRPPHAFVLDATGVILWAGHPLALDPVLAQIAAGGFDAARAKRLARLGRELDELVEGMTLANRDDAMRELLAKTALILELDPFDDKAIQLRVQVAGHLGDSAAIRSTYASMPLDAMTADRANSYAWKLATAENLVDRNLDLALAFARRAVAADPASASCLDTEARVFYELGLVDRAIAAEEQAATLEGADADVAGNLAFYRAVKALAAGVR